MPGASWGPRRSSTRWRKRSPASPANASVSTDATAGTPSTGAPPPHCLASSFRTAGATVATVGGLVGSTAFGRDGALPPSGMKAGTLSRLNLSSSSTSSFFGLCSPSVLEKRPALPSRGSTHNGIVIPLFSCFPRPSPSFQPIFCNIRNPNPSAIGRCKTSLASCFIRLICPFVTGWSSSSLSVTSSSSPSLSFRSSFSRWRRSS
mmetsp:Transcript_153022/g.388789  ORF Transcript_153022/g.388789 Transcript_153022/m.388789 type:complete len:205 (-) Transcript_153022:1131-1745(-)